jgi:hypothetical protein
MNEFSSTDVVALLVKPRLDMLAASLPWWGLPDRFSGVCIGLRW